jgi:uncharacterized Tic20 family protein
MFEKVPAARMNNGRNSSTEHLIGTAHANRREHASLEGISHFPSYLRLFEKFLGPLIFESYRGAARLWDGCWGKFPAAQAHVAFL